MGSTFPPRGKRERGLLAGTPRGGVLHTWRSARRLPSAQAWSPAWTRGRFALVSQVTFRISSIGVQTHTPPGAASAPQPAGQCARGRIRVCAHAGAVVPGAASGRGAGGDPCGAWQASREAHEGFH